MRPNLPHPSHLAAAKNFAKFFPMSVAHKTNIAAICSEERHSGLTHPLLLPETLQKIFQCPQAHDEHSSNLQRATFRPDPPPPVAGNFAKIFQMSMGAINISCKASYLPASQQAAICGAQQRLEGMGQVRADILGCLDGTQFFLAGLKVPGSSKGARSGGLPSRHEKWQFWSILDHFIGIG
jgi:hypothetical protein